MYVNTVIDDGTEIAALMGCFHQEMITDPRFPEIGKRVHYLKEDKIRKELALCVRHLKKSEMMVVQKDVRKDVRKEWIWHCAIPLKA